MKIFIVCICKNRHVDAGDFNHVSFATSSVYRNEFNIAVHLTCRDSVPAVTTSFALTLNKRLICVHFYENMLHHIVLTSGVQLQARGPHLARHSDFSGPRKHSGKIFKAHIC